MKTSPGPIFNAIGCTQGNMYGNENKQEEIRMKRNKSRIRIAVEVGPWGHWNCAMVEYRTEERITLAKFIL